MNKKTQKQEQHIEILEKSQQFLEDVQQPLSRHTFLKGENFVANILIKAVKIATDTIEISEGLTYEADLNGL
ncbi:hypothetical protein [Gemmiger formicilis]|uniref:hypothetical protein n=1 Tax=Gemmiger formicilis TaxID=745368 RepID=UPI00399674E6